MYSGRGRALRWRCHGRDIVEKSAVAERAEDMGGENADDAAAFVAPEEAAVVVGEWHEERKRLWICEQMRRL